MGVANRQTAATPVNKDEFSGSTTSGSININFDGDLNTKSNRIESINIQVTGKGARVKSIYRIRRQYRVDYSM